MKLRSGIALLFALHAAAGALAGQTAAIRGLVEWQGPAAERHPARGVRVEVVDAGTLRTLSTTRTDETGHYRVVVDVGGTPRQVRVRAVADSRVAFVHSYKKPDLWMLQTNPIRLAPGTTPNVSFNGTRDTENNDAFSVLDALHAIQPFVLATRGTPLPRVEVVFPSGKPSSFFHQGKLHIGRHDRWDWDVILHEYGHYVSAQHQLANNPGGEHRQGRHLGNHMSKDNALRLAWGEGWATYFSITGQLGARTGSVLPNVGDTRYTDGENSSLDFDLGSQHGDPSLGEDYEVSTARVLFDLEDGMGAYDSLALGARTVWAGLAEERAHTLGAGLRRLLRNVPHRDSLYAGLILAHHQIAPVVREPADQAVAGPTPPTFRWARSGAASSKAFRNERYHVRFYDAAGALLFQSPVLADTVYTPDPTTWDRVRRASPSPVLWVVYNLNPDAPVTGPYVGTARRLITTP